MVGFGRDILGPFWSGPWGARLMRFGPLRDVPDLVLRERKNPQNFLISQLHLKKTRESVRKAIKVLQSHDFHRQNSRSSVVIHLVLMDKSTKSQQLGIDQQLQQYDIRIHDQRFGRRRLKIGRVEIELVKEKTRGCDMDQNRTQY